MNLKLFSICLLLTSSLSAENIESIIQKNQKAALPEFPTFDAATFISLQKAAQNRNANAQVQLPSQLTTYLKSVYKVVAQQKGLLFSVRRPVRGYDKAKSNYSVNIQEFFEAITDGVRVKKSNFEVTAKDGTVWQVTVLKYKPDGAMIEVKKDGQVQWIPVADLCDNDRRFIGSALIDEEFESSGEFIISSSDSRSDGASSEREKVSHVHSETGEQVEGAFVSVSMNDLSRKIILENKSSFPMENLVVEYQSFAEQTIMKRPKDFPSDYRCVGFYVIQSLSPGEKKELALKLPESVTAKQETVNTGEYEYYRVIPSDCNQKSEGRINGIWVKVHRFTPYGEHLLREYKSAPAEWVNVAPVGTDIRR